MKKYKLIKEYPGSPELGYICKSFNSYFESDHSHCKPSDYPKFWEEIVEKNYEILSFKQNSKIKDLWEAVDITCNKFARKSGKMFCTTPYSLEKILNNPLYDIHSVKRLSDGEIFTVGDKLDSGINKLTINSITLSVYNELLLSPYEVIGTINIKNAFKYKKPLFTTEDGVDIFENENGEIKYWTLQLPNAHTHYQKEWKISDAPVIFKNLIPHPSEDLKRVGILRFSTKEAAEEYTLMNKPCLSINDLRGKYSKFTESKESITTFLKKLVKSKMQE